MKAFIFDTETNGLIRNRTLKLDKQPSVIEFYGATFDLAKGPKPINEFHSLIKPPLPLSDTPAPGDKKTITQMTGITNEMLEGAPAFIDVYKPIFERIEAAKVAIAQNASFDKDMIEVEAERISQKVKWPRLICTVEATIGLKGFRLSQTALYEHLFQKQFAGAHRAKVDVIALAECCVELFKMGAL